MEWLAERKERARGEALWRDLSAARSQIEEMGYTDFDELLTAIRNQPEGWTAEEWAGVHDSAQQMLDDLSAPVRLEMTGPGGTLVTEFVPLTGESRQSGSLGGWEEEYSRYFDGPFTAERPTGPTAAPADLLEAVPCLAETLASPNRDLPALRDHSWRCGEPLGHKAWLSDWFDEWTADDAEILAGTWTDPEWDAIVLKGIAEFSFRWPPKVARTIHLRHPDAVNALGAAHDADPRFSRKRDAHRDRWVETALTIGLHELYRHRVEWPNPEAMLCPICGRAFAPETLSPWSRWIDRLGPLRYCHSCLVRALNGRPDAVTPEYVRAAVSGLAAALEFVPTTNIRQVDIGAIGDERRRDVVMANLMCLPTPDACAEGLGIEGGRGKWLHILQASGVVGDTWRPARGTLCVARDGHACRSLGERSIDDWLSANDIAHECEPSWPEHSELNPAKLKRADWLLPGNVFVEYAGMLGDAEYQAKLDKKIELAQQEGITLLVLTPDDLIDLGGVFSAWCP